MRRPPRKRSTPPEQPNASPGETLARAAVMPRRADAGTRSLGAHYEALALLGEIGGGGAAYLVREQVRGDLAVARLLKRKQGDTGGRPIVAMLRELDGSVPAPGAPCPSCGSALTAWAQKCVKCGARLAAPPTVTNLALAEASRFTLLGTMPVYGGGSVAFATRTADGAVVALHAREWHDVSGDHLVLVEAGPLSPPPKDALAQTVIAPTPIASMAAIPEGVGSGASGVGVESGVGHRESGIDTRDQAAAADGDLVATPHAPVPTPALDEEPPMAEMPTDVIDTIAKDGQGQLHEPTRLIRSSNLSSGALARQSMPIEAMAVPKVCPMCGTEYETEARFCPKDGSALRPKGGNDPIVGQIIADRYHVLKRVGEGGMGRVYLAEHVRMGRMCAIKVMRSALLNDDEAMARFAREASNAARILHPNVAAVFDYGESDGVVYLVMELVDGEALSSILARERALPVPRVLDLAKQVTEALIAAHEMGVVHRDLKPDNILIARRGEREVAKVVDFGIAKALAESPHEALTRSGLVIGTPEFMSPEQLLGDPVDARTDLYSLGCIIFLMLTGTQAAEAPTREAMLKRRLHELPPHPRAVNRALPPDLDAIVVRLLASSPDERFSSATELREALERVHPDAQDVTPVAPAIAQATPGRGPAALRFDTPTPGQKPRRSLVKRIAMLAGGAAVGVVTAYMLYSATQDPLSRQASGENPPGTAQLNDSAIVTPPAQGATLPPNTGTQPGTQAQGTTKGVPGAVVVPPLTAPIIRLDTATRPQRPSGNAGFYAPIYAYAAALQTGDMNRVKQVHPAIAPQRERGYARLFEQAQMVRVQVVSPDLHDISGDTARVSFRLRMRTRDRRTGEVIESAPIPHQAVLVKRSNIWFLYQVQ
jgi:tRNA A-37 threonylcarbamoyl transferase component Bud32